MAKDKTPAPKKRPQDMHVLDKEDKHMQKVANKQDNPDNWIRGWNRVKYGLSIVEKTTTKKEQDNAED